MAALPKHILRAIKSGPIPKVRNWRLIAKRAKDATDLTKKLTLAERTMLFIESVMCVPDGELQGQPFSLDLFQEVFIYAVYDNPRRTRRAYLSIARKNGKTGLIAALLIAHLIGPLATGSNSQLISGAMSRDQAALVYDLAEKIIQKSPLLQQFLRPVHSRKTIINLATGHEYRAISAQHTTAHGLSPKVAILDEIGQVVGPGSPFIDAITTAQGAHGDDALLIAISTSAASDADLFSIWCDDAERAGLADTVCHVYQSEPECDLMDRTQWRYANPAMGKFRSLKDLKQQMEQAERLPSMENTTRLLLLNQRVALENLWLSPSVWKGNNGEPDWQVALANGGHLGLDLSQKNDLTAAVLACQDDNGLIHVFCFAFTPLEGIEARSRRDRVPYNEWVRDGLMYAPPGKRVDYDWVAQFIKTQLEDKGVYIRTIQFDDWRIEDFKRAAERQNMALEADWVNVRQGYKSMTPRVEAMETALLQNKIRHGSHPVLNLGAASAINVKDPTGGSKLDKTKASNKIDAIIAMLMAVYPILTAEDDDVSWWIA